MFDDLIFWAFLLFPIGYAIIMKILKYEEFSWLEVGFNVILCAGLIAGTWSLGRFAGSWDTETWNGSITSKDARQENCQTGWSSFKDDFCTVFVTKPVRDYPDRCFDIRNSKGVKTGERCTPRYHTEYRYIYDWERRYFLASANLNSSWEIPRVDSQGINEPGRYQSTNVGDPASIRSFYHNWVRGASESLFHEDGSLEERYKEDIPKYPGEIYDLYNIDRVIPVGVDIPDLRLWNYDLGKILTTLGPERQMNAIILIVDATKYDIGYAYAVRRGWYGFKKNDAVIFIGVNGAQQIQWAEVLSWSKENLFNIELRNKIDQGNNVLDRETVMTAIYETGMKSYIRKSMEEFEYLKADIPVPLWLTIVVALISIGGSIGLSLIMLRIDLGSAISSRLSRF